MGKELNRIMIILTIALVCFMVFMYFYGFEIFVVAAEVALKNVRAQTAISYILVGFFMWVLPWLLQVMVTLYVFLRTDHRSEEALKSIKESIASLQEKLQENKK